MHHQLLSACSQPCMAAGRSSSSSSLSSPASWRSTVPGSACALVCHQLHQASALSQCPDLDGDSGTTSCWSPAFRTWLAILAAGRSSSSSSSPASWRSTAPGSAHCSHSAATMPSAQRALANCLGLPSASVSTTCTALRVKFLYIVNKRQDSWSIRRTLRLWHTA